MRKALGRIGLKQRKRGTLGQELTQTVGVWLTQVGLLGALWGFASLFVPAAHYVSGDDPFAPMVATLPVGMAAVLTLTGPLAFAAGYFLKVNVKARIAK